MSTTTGNRSGRCEKCGACSNPKQKRVGCNGTSPGECVDVEAPPLCVGDIEIVEATPPEMKCTFEHCRGWMGLLLWNALLFFAARKFREHIKSMHKEQERQTTGFRVLKCLMSSAGSADGDQTNTLLLKETNDLLRDHKGEAGQESAGRALLG